jgi:4-diphosphocytidyl-2-C-methyl-D-erythritol kinase
MLTFPNCKINLGLSIVEKRPDFYHNIETVFYPIPLFDILEVVPSKNGETTFTSSGIVIPGGQNQNLCLKAYHLLANDYELAPVNIHLQKNIPIGAGLGGGSSDAAHTLVLLNDLFGLNLTSAQLINYASSIGADCPFFILNKPDFAYGVGNQFKDIDVRLNDYFIVIVKPSIHISTAEAYAGITLNKKANSIDVLIQQHIDSWSLVLNNDFEPSIFRKYPEIENIKKILYEKGAVYASMSGSGSSVFGLFKSEVNLKDEFLDFFYWSSVLTKELL